MADPQPVLSQEFINWLNGRLNFTRVKEAAYTGLVRTDDPIQANTSIVGSSTNSINSAPNQQGSVFSDEVKMNGNFTLVTPNYLHSTSSVPTSNDNLKNEIKTAIDEKEVMTNIMPKWKQYHIIEAYRRMLMSLRQTRAETLKHQQANEANLRTSDVPDMTRIAANQKIDKGPVTA
jgi:hypothetical protein